MPLHIAVTGATGFVGKALVPKLLADGHRLSVLVRNLSATNFPTDVRVVGGDLHDTAALNEMTRGVDVVLNVAGVVSAVTREAFFRTNVDGAVALAKIAVSNGVKRFVHVSSLAAREPELNDYGASKAAAEREIAALTSKISLCMIRPAAVYGPGDTATLPLLKALLSNIAFIPGTADQCFAMVHVDDVARALNVATSSEVTGVFELDDGCGGHDWPELIALTRKNFAAPQRAYYIPKSIALAVGYVGDGVAKLRGRPSIANSGQIKQIYHRDWCVKSLTWKLADPVSLHVGLLQTIRWYQAAGLLPKQVGAVRSAAQDGTTD